MKFIVFSASLLVAASSFAQNCKEQLTGLVRDHHTLQPVPFARLLIPELDLQQSADSTGQFSFSGLCPGTVVVRCIPHFGCEPVDMAVAIPTSGSFDFLVETHVTDLDELVISVSRFKKESQAVSRIHALDLSAVSGNTLGEQLARVPGMTTFNTGSSIVKPVINGMHSNRIVVVNNGIRQEGQQWGSEHAPEIDPNLATELEVIQGAAGLQHGPDAIGGVILVHPAALPYGQGTSGWIKSEAHSNGKGGMLSGLVNGTLLPSGNWAYRVHGTARINGTQHTPDYLVKNTAMQEYSFSGATGYRSTRFEADAFYSLFATKLGIFTGSHIGNLTDLNEAFQAKEPKEKGEFTYAIDNPQQFVQHQVGRVFLGWNWNERVKTTLIGGYQHNLRQEYDNHASYNDSIEALGLPDFELNLWTTNAELKTTIVHSKRFHSAAGLSGLKQENAYSGRFFIPNFRKFQAGAYYTGTYETTLWQLEGGLRYDISMLTAYYYKGATLVAPERTFGHLSAAAGASRIIGHHWLVKLNFGTAWRPPSVNELYSNGLHHGAAAIERGNELLNKEIVYNLQLGTQYRSRLAKLDVQVFANRFDGYINLMPVLPPQLTIVGAFPVFDYRQSDILLSGVNGQLEIPFLKRLRYTLQGSWLYAAESGSRTPVYGIPSNRITNRLRYTPKTGKQKWVYFAELEGTQVFHQNRVPENADYVAPPPGYFLLNGAVGISRKKGTAEAFQLILSVTNLGNVSYRDYMNRFRYFTDEPGRNWTLRLLVPFSIHSKNEQK